MIHKAQTPRISRKMWLSQRRARTGNLNVKFNAFSFRSLFLLGYVTLKRRYPQMEALCHLNGKGIFRLEDVAEIFQLLRQPLIFPIVQKTSVLASSPYQYTEFTSWRRIDTSLWDQFLLTLTSTHLDPLVSLPFPATSWFSFWFLSL